MNKNDIIALPNPLLKQKSKRVGIVDQSILTLAGDMIDATLDWEDSRRHEIGAALAAVQVAQPHRVVVIRRDFDNRDNRDFDIYINPEIVKSEGEPTEDMEGCLSVRDIYGAVKRYPKVKVKALDQTGKLVRVTATGFLARVFQHEIDHTNGMVFTDRIDDPSKLYHLETDGKFTPIHSL